MVLTNFRLIDNNLCRWSPTLQIVILQSPLIRYISIWIFYLYLYQDDDISLKTSQTAKPQSVRLPFPAKQPAGHQPPPAG